MISILQKWKKGDDINFASCIFDSKYGKVVVKAIASSGFQENTQLERTEVDV